MSSIHIKDLYDADSSAGKELLRRLGLHGFARVVLAPGGHLQV